MRIQSLSILAMLSLALLLQVPTANAQNTDSTIVARIDSSLVRLALIHERIKDIHPFENVLRPIAVVEDSELYIFDADSTGMHYRFISKQPEPFPMMPGIRASFPLSCYGDRPTCVVSEDAFQTINGYMEILHEFVHCSQYLTCEQKLKDQLEVAKVAAEKKDFMWELNHPFPYTDSSFVATYTAFLTALGDNDQVAVEKYKSALKSMLSQQDYEYMVWQEWKEGFARMIENKIRTSLGMGPNNFGSEQPYTRITFYYGGEKYIDFLVAQQPELYENVEGLFGKMMN